MFRENYRSAICILLLICILIATFYKTVFFGIPISKICQLPAWDSLFEPYRNTAPQNMDPSLIQLMVPYYFFVAKIWHVGNIPLWNSLSGFGCPLIGDPQAAVFSVWHIPLALFPSMETYNLILVLKLIVLSISTFYLARLLNLSRLASLYAAITITFCPYIQWYLELIGAGYCFLPVIFALYFKVAINASSKNIIFASIASSILIYSSHPEISFFGILFASLFAFVIICTQNNVSLKEHLAITSKILAKIGVLTFFLSAPMLLPFIEYLKNSYCYKFASGSGSYIPWQSFFLNLIQPAYKQASPFLGTLTIPFFVLGIKALKDNHKFKLPVLILFFAAFIFSCKIFPLNFLALVKPVSFLVFTYCFPILLLFTVIISAFGFDKLFKFNNQNINSQRKDWLYVLVAALLMLLATLILTLSHQPLKFANFDMTLPDSILNLRDYMRNMTILAIYLTLLTISAFWYKNKNFYIFIAITCIVLGLFSQFSISKTSLTTQSKFDYPLVEPLSKIQQDYGRCLGLGNHLFKPNSNVMFNIPLLNCHNPLFPDKYLQFMEKAGANIDEFNQFFEQPYSRLLDLSSTKYVLSATPLNVESKYKLIDTTKQLIYLYKNEEALPEAYLVSKIAPASNAKEALAHISLPDFDFKHTVVIEGSNNRTNNVSTNPRPENDTVKTYRPNNNSVILQTNCSEAKTLILTDIFYPGWVATVDGKETNILKANYLFRGLSLSAGKHIIEFHYRPLSFLIGLVMMCLALGTILFKKQF